MNQVIFKHTQDTNDSVLFEGSKTACKAYVANMKKVAAKNLTVWGWCNGGFSIKGMYYVEIR